MMADVKFSSGARRAGQAVPPSPDSEWRKSLHQCPAFDRLEILITHFPLNALSTH